MTASPRKLGFILLGLSALRLLIWAACFHPSGPLGTDPAIWGLTALDLSAGHAPLAVPLYPWILDFWPESLIQGGLRVSWIAAWLLPLAAWWAARPFGDRAALTAGLVTLLLPDPIQTAFELQPDALTALWAVVLTGALLRGKWLWIALLVGTGVVLREHGPPVAGLLILGALFQPKKRLQRAGLVLAFTLFTPVLLGGTIGLNQPWSARSAEAIGLLTTQEKPPHLRRGEWQQFQKEGPLGRIQWHSERSLRLAPDSWAWLGLGLFLVAWVRDKRLLLAALPLLPVFGALIIWSERRHVAVMSPVAAILLACALSQLPKSGLRKTVALLLSLLTLIGLTRLPQAGQRQARESTAFAPVQAVAEKVCALAGPEDLLLAHDQRLLLWCPLAQLADPGSSAAWKSWLVAPPNSIQAPWTPIYTALKGAWIWQWSPETTPRPCQQPTPTARYLLASGPTAHPAFPHIPMPGQPPLRFPPVADCTQ